MEKQDITLTEQFVTLSRLMMHRHHHMRGAQPHDPFRGQGRVLSLLKMEPEMSQKKLAYLLGIRPQSMGELLTKLEQNGYITRTQSAEDRRAMNIHLTDKGAEVAASNEQFHEQERKADEIFNCLSEDERKNLAGYLDRIIEAYQEAVNNEQAEFPEQCPHPHWHHDCRRGFGEHGHGDPRMRFGERRPERF